MFKKLPKNSSFPYYLALIATYLIWAGATPVVKLTLDFIPPFSFLLLRFLVVGIVLLPYTIIMVRRTAIHRDDVIKLVILGLVSQTSISFIFIGLRFTSAIESTIIGLIGPILAVMAGHYIYHEKVNWHIKLGLAVATFGSLFVAAEPILNSEYNEVETGLRLLGNFFIILNSLSFLAYVIWSKMMLGEKSKETKRILKFMHIKQFKKHYSPVFITVLSFYVGLATFIPLALLENIGFFGDYYFSIQNFTLTPILGVIYMGLLSSIVAYIAYEWSLTKVEVKDSALFSYLNPILALPFAYLLLGELPNQFMITGGFFIALGVVIAELKKS